MLFWKKTLKLAIVLFIFWGTDCKKNEKSDRSGSDSNTNTLILGNKMTTQIGIKLADRGYTKAQIEIISTNALDILFKAVKNKKSTLHLFKESEFEVAAKAVAEGAVAALANKDIKMDSDEKVKVVYLISGAIVKSLGSLASDLDDKDVAKLPAIIASAAISNLDKAKIAKKSFDTAMKWVMSEIVANLDDAGLSGIKEYKDAVDNMMKQSFASLKNTGLDSDNFADYFDDLVAGSLEGFDELGFEKVDELQDIASFMTEASINSLEGVVDFGVESYVRLCIKSIGLGTSKALGEFEEEGLLSVDDISTMLAPISENAATLLETFIEKNDFETYSEWAAKYSAGFLIGFSEAGLTQEEIGTLQNNLSEGICSKDENESTCKASLESSFDELEAEYRANCEAAGGTWEDDATSGTKVCNSTEEKEDEDDDSPGEGGDGKYGNGSAQ